MNLFTLTYSEAFNLYKIYIDSGKTPIGTISYLIKNKTLYIRYLTFYISHRRKGFLKKFINWCFEAFDITSIFGECLIGTKQIWTHVCEGSIGRILPYHWDNDCNCSFLIYKNAESYEKCELYINETQLMRIAKGHKKQKRKAV